MSSGERLLATSSQTPKKGIRVNALLSFVIVLYYCMAMAHAICMCCMDVLRNKLQLKIQSLKHAGTDQRWRSPEIS